MSSVASSSSRAPVVPSKAQQQRLPSPKFLLGAATHAFLLRQHGRCLALLSQLALGLAPPSTAWPEAEHAPAREHAREAIRRQAAVLWLTSVACLVADDAGTIAAAASPPGPSSPAGSSYVGSLTGDSRTDDAIRSGSAPAVQRALVGRCESLYAPLSPAAPPGASPRRLSSRSAAGIGSSSSSGRGELGSLSTPVPLPPQVVQTLLLAGQKLGIRATESASVVLAPFQAAIPLSLQHRLAGLSRARESEREFAPAPPTAANEGWLGGILDGYEAVAQTWAVDVLCAPTADEHNAAEALRFVREDMVLGRARKTDLIDSIQRTRVALCSVRDRNRHLDGSKSASSRRPPSPGLSSSSSSSASSLNSVRTMTPPVFGTSHEAVVPRASSKGPAASGYVRQVDAIHRFLAPRVPAGSSVVRVEDEAPPWPAIDDGDGDGDEWAECITPRPTSSTSTGRAGPPSSSALAPRSGAALDSNGIGSPTSLRSLSSIRPLLSAVLRTLLRPNALRLILALVLGLLGLLRRRRQNRQASVAAAGGAAARGSQVGEAVRRRLGGGGSWSHWGR